MHKFASAAEVKCWLRGKGIKGRVSVHRIRNPFTGVPLFMVGLADVPAGVAIVISSGGTGPTTYGSSDGGKTAKCYQALEEALKGTTAAVVGMWEE